MTALSEIQIGQRFSFEVYPSAILGNGFKDVTLEGFISPSMAQAFGTDIAAMHANVYRTLPSTTPTIPSNTTGCGSNTRTVRSAPSVSPTCALRASWWPLKACWTCALLVSPPLTKRASWRRSRPTVIPHPSTYCRNNNTPVSNGVS